MDVRINAARTLRALLSLTLAANLTIGQAAARAIGMATANGAFRLDQAPVTRTGTILDGATIETLEASSRLDLETGVRILVGAKSRGRVHGDRLILESGQAQAENAPGYVVEARTLRIGAAERSGTALVSLVGDYGVRVAALRGTVTIRNAQNQLLASLAAGKALELAMAGADPSHMIVTGTLEKRNGRLFLTDETTAVTVELVGEGLEKEIGKRVTVKGEIDLAAKTEPGAAFRVRATNWTRAADKPSQPQTPAKSGAQQGLSALDKAVIAGVIVAASGTGAAIALTRSGKPATISQ